MTKAFGQVGWPGKRNHTGGYMRISKRLGAFALGLIMAGTGLAFSAPAQAAAGAVPIVKQAPPSDPGKAILGKDRKVHPDERAGVTALATNYYSYTVGAMTGTGTGIKFDMNVESPWKSPAEIHTLAQAAVCKDGNTDDCVEFGWIKGSSTTVCPAGTSNVCMFAGVRVGGVWRGYQGTEWVDNPSNTTIHRQISLNGAVGGQRHWRVTHNDTLDRWEVGYGTGANGSSWYDVVGWFPDSVWGGTFTSASYNTVYTESVSDQRAANLQCTDHGVGTLPTATGGGHRIWNIDLLGTTGETMNAFVSPAVTGRGAVEITDAEGRFGGGGPC